MNKKYIMVKMTFLLKATFLKALPSKLWNICIIRFHLLKYLLISIDWSFREVGAHLSRSLGPHHHFTYGFQLPIIFFEECEVICFQVFCFLLFLFLFSPKQYLPNGKIMQRDERNWSL